MNEKLKEQICEIIAMAETCPEPYKVECFKILLLHQLRGNIHQQSETEQGNNSESEDTKEKEQREIKDSDLHHKFRKFMKDYNIDIEKINQLFYFENGSFLDMYDDLKKIKTSEIQIRIALLQAMIQAMNCGDFVFDGESVRAECQKRKAYDGNFTTNFKNNASFFEGFVSYEKGTPVKLSEIGKNELAKVIEELSK